MAAENKILTCGEHLRNLREKQGLTLKNVAESIGIDISLLAKIERNERRANINIIEDLSQVFNIEKKELLIDFYSDIVSYEIEDENNYTEILKAAEAKIEFKRSQKLKENG